MNVLSDSAMKELVRQMNADDTFPTVQMTLGELKKLIKSGFCVIHCDEQGVFGFIGCSTARSPKYIEIGPVWVAARCRNTGLAGTMFKDLMDKLGEKDECTLFLITSCPIASNIATSHGWIMVSDWSVSPHWSTVPKSPHPNKMKNRRATLYHTTHE